jgi:hypothetical protein
LREAHIMDGPSTGICGTAPTAAYSGMAKGVEITIEVPFDFAERDRLLEFMKPQFPDAQISIEHAEVDKPTVAETLIEHSPSDAASDVESEDSESILVRASEALKAFTKAPQ